MRVAWQTPSSSFDRRHSGFGLPADMDRPVHISWQIRIPTVHIRLLICTPFRGIGPPIIPKKKKF
jgi:hypothetical protein